MSFCNPNRDNLDDFFIQAPELPSDLTDRRYPTPTVPPVFTGASIPENEGNGPSIGIPATKSDVIGFEKFLRDTGRELNETADYFNRLGLTTARVESAFARVGNQLALGTFSIGDFFRDFNLMRESARDLQNILAEGLGLDGQGWYESIKRTQSKLEPLGRIASRFGQLVRNSDNGGTAITDDIISLLFVDIAAAITDIVGSNTGLGKLVTSIASAVVDLQVGLKVALGAFDALDDYGVAVLDIAEGMMSAGLGMAAAICEMIPMMISMAIAIYEMIKGLIMALLAFLADPLGSLPKFSLDIDWSKLFKMPPIDLFRKLRNRWARFTGTAFKLWKTVEAECSPDTWGTAPGPFKMSEAALSVGKVATFGSQLAISGADAPIGVAAAGKALDAKLLAGAAAAVGFGDKTKSLLHIQPAKVNTTPSSAGLLGFITGSTVPADPSVFSLPSGLGSINSSKTNSLHSSGIPVAPDLQRSIANHMDVAADLTGIIRSAEVCAVNTYDAGRSIKTCMDPNTSDEDVLKHLKKIMKASRRQRFIQPGSWNSKDGATSLIAADYFACEEKAVKSKFDVNGMQEALDKMPSIYNQPPGLPGSILFIAAETNPSIMATSDNNKGVSSTEGHIVVKPATQATSAYDGSPVPMSAEVQLGDKDLPTDLEISGPDDPLLSAATENVDRLIGLMPIAAFPSGYHDENQKLVISSLLSDNATDYQILPLYLICKNSSEVSLLADLIAIAAELDNLDITVAEGLLTKVTLQGLSGNNSLTWLSEGRRVVQSLNQYGTTKVKMLDLLEGFIMHSRYNIKPLLEWLRSTENRDTESPAVPSGLTDEELALAGRSLNFVKAHNKDHADSFITLRFNADEVGGPMGYELPMFLTVDSILTLLEDKHVDGINVKDKLDRLLPLAQKLTNYPALVGHIKALIAASN